MPVKSRMLKLKQRKSTRKEEHMQACYSLDWPYYTISLLVVPAGTIYWPGITMRFYKPLGSRWGHEDDATFRPTWPLYRAMAILMHRRTRCDKATNREM